MSSYIPNTNPLSGYGQGPEHLFFSREQRPLPLLPSGPTATPGASPPPAAPPSLPSYSGEGMSGSGAQQAQPGVNNNYGDVMDAARIGSVVGTVLGTMTGIPGLGMLGGGLVGGLTGASLAQNVNALSNDLGSRGLGQYGQVNVGDVALSAAARGALGILGGIAGAGRTAAQAQSMYGHLNAISDLGLAPATTTQDPTMDAALAQAMSHAANNTTLGGLTAVGGITGAQPGSQELGGRMGTMAQGGLADGSKGLGAPELSSEIGSMGANEGGIAEGSLGGGQDGGAKMAGGGRVRGLGGGLDDMVPATINGNRLARLSTDEFVIPADVVSAIGDGSSTAGHRQLYDMMKNIRQEKFGSARQPGRLSQGLSAYVR